MKAIKIISLLTLALYLNSCDTVDNADVSGDWLIPADEIFDGGPGRDGIPSVDNPQFTNVNEAPYLLDDDLVIVEKQILSNVSQKVEMADKIRNSRKYLLNGPHDSNAHIMHQCNRIAVVILDTLKKWDEQLFLLRRNLNVIQNQFRDSIHATKQMWTVPLACPVYMKNISTPLLH